MKCTGKPLTRGLQTLLALVICLGICIPLCAGADGGNPGSTGFITVVSPPPSADFYTATRYGTAPFRVSFFDRSTGTQPLDYLWDFGDGTTSHEQNPTHTFGATGEYTLRLTVSNRFGQDTKVMVGYIAAGTPPAPVISATPAQGNVPLTVQFTDVSAGDGTRSWHWDFGDGTTSTGQNPVHTYGKAGIYAVTLSTTNRFGTAQVTRAGLINTGITPDADFVATTRNGDPPLTVEFRDFSTGSPTTWSWDFGDGTTSTEQNPVHTYRDTGAYTATLEVANAFGRDARTRPSYILAGTPPPLPAPTDTPIQEVPPAGAGPGDGIFGLIREAKGTAQKNLPTSGLIPPQFMALAAVLTSLAVVVVNVLVSNIGMLSQVGGKSAKFFFDLLGGHAVEKVSAAEVEKRGISAQHRERHFFGLSAFEVIIVEVAILMVALAFLLADRAELSLETVLIYIIVGAVSVVLHDFAHRYFATRHGCDADIQFWGLGTIIMFLTAWLYGNAFAQSYRNLVKREGKEDIHEIGIEMVAGPVVSIILMLMFLAFIPLGGLWGVAGGVGFSINLITAVYSLMPIETMDGLGIWKWSRGIYLALFLPLIAFYFVTYVIL